MKKVSFGKLSDGQTGEQQDINCWACGKPMTSKQWRLAGKLLWTTIHPSDHCEDLARQICNGPAGRIANWKKDKPKPNWNQAADA